MKRWSRETFLKPRNQEGGLGLGETFFTCGPWDMRLRQWYEYASANQDEAPLFVFDKLFQERAPEMLADYDVPRVFRDRDLFDLLGKDLSRSSDISENSHFQELTPD